MIKSSNFYLLYIAIWYFTSVTEVKSYDALLFDITNEKLVDINEESKICSSICLLACPSFRGEHNSIDKFGTVSGTGIYQYEIDMTFDPESAKKAHIETYVKVCGKQYKPVMVQDKTTKSYETGYELFYEHERAALQCEKYEQFKKVVNRDVVETEAQNSDPDARSSVVSKTKENRNTVFQVPSISNDKWVFYWVSVLSIQVPAEGHRQVSFTKDDINNNHQSFSMCKDYSLEDHSRFLPSRDWADERNSSTQPTNKEEKEKNPDQANIALKETQIMPMRYFHTLSARLATCTYLNLAYVSKNLTVERLQVIDLYLYSIYRAWPSKVEIIFGVAGTSKEASQELLESSRNNEQSERLRKFPIPFPGILYRIVEYKADGKIYNAIVVIHNIDGFETVLDEERICPPESELQGWSGLGQGKVYRGFDHLAGLTYTCPVMLETIQKLKANYEKVSAESFNLDEDQQKEILNQKQFVLMQTNEKRV